MGLQIRSAEPAYQDIHSERELRVKSKRQLLKEVNKNRKNAEKVDDLIESNGSLLGMKQNSIKIKRKSKNDKASTNARFKEGI